VECQLDFAQLGLLTDPGTGKRRRVHALIFTAVVSRHMFVWLTYSQTLTAVIAGCEAAWEFFGGAFKVLIRGSPCSSTPCRPATHRVVGAAGLVRAAARTGRPSTARRPASHAAAPRS
jgi:hypothetical protein